MNFISKHKRKILLTSLGIIAGFTYYYFWACTDACPITSSPYRNMALGGIVGFILAR